jgi:hypothetical protein
MASITKKIPHNERASAQRKAPERIELKVFAGALAQRLGLDEPESIGEGAFGEAFRVQVDGVDKVIKVTTDYDEVFCALKLVNYKHEHPDYSPTHLVDIDAVHTVECEGERLHAILMEAVSTHAYDEGELSQRVSDLECIAHAQEIDNIAHIDIAHPATLILINGLDTETRNLLRDIQAAAEEANKVGFEVGDAYDENIGVTDRGYTLFDQRTQWDCHMDALMEAEFERYNANKIKSLQIESEAVCQMLTPELDTTPHP